MKKQYIVALMLSCLMFLGCNFSKGTKTNLRTGLSFNYNGFIVQDVLLVDAANKIMTDNKVQINTQMAIVAVGMASYGLKDGKAFPGMMLMVTDKKGTPIISAKDLFEGAAGFPPEKATELCGSITVARPMTAGETYHVKMRIWDKVTPDNVINADADLVVM